MVRQAMDFVTAFDPELGRMIEAEYKRQAINSMLRACRLYSASIIRPSSGSNAVTKSIA